MTKHYSEADLLETYYMQPGESMPVMMHLASCPDCAGRYERLEAKLHEAASCHTSDASVDGRPETFWSRQRHTIMRSIGVRRERTAFAVRTTRTAAAALLAFVLGGAVVYESVKPHMQPASITTVTLSPNPSVVAPPAEEPALTRDPWQSDELRDFHGVVAWESWVEPQPSKGGKSL